MSKDPWRDTENLIREFRRNEMQEDAKDDVDRMMITLLQEENIDFKQLKVLQELEIEENMLIWIVEYSGNHFESAKSYSFTQLMS